MSFNYLSLCLKPVSEKVSKKLSCSKKYAFTIRGNNILRSRLYKGLRIVPLLFSLTVINF